MSSKPESPGPDVSASHQAIPESASASNSRRSLVPPWRLWGIAVGILGLIGLMQVGWHHLPWPRRLSVLNDHTFVNITTLILSFLLLNLFGFWFFLRSDYSRRVRWIIGTLLEAALIFAATALQIEGVSGELVPILRWRGSPPRDRLLATPDIAAPATIDVKTTSEFDFPGFLGPQRQARYDAVELDPDWQARPPRERWRRPIGAGWSGFAAVHGYALTLEQRGEQELVTCYSIASGEPVWVHAIAGRHETLIGGVGPRSTPVIVDGRVYTLGALGVLLCLDGATGTLIWQQDLLARIPVTREQDLQAVAWGRSNSPLVVDNLVIIPLGGPRGGPYVSLAAFDRETGELIWQAGDRQVSYASPTLAELGGRRQIVSVNEDQVSAHDPQTGVTLWTVPWAGNSAANASVSQPVPIPPDQLLLSKGYGQGAALFRLVPAAAGTPWSVESVWANERMLKTKFTNVVLHQQYVYGLSDGILECLELATGTRAWKSGRYGHGQILGVRDHLLVLGEEGELVLVAADPRTHRELGRIAVLAGKTWNNLCLYGSQLLLRNGSEAVCYELATLPPSQTNALP